jgi:hypothetical protein
MDPEMVCLDCRQIEAEEHAENAGAIHARPLPPKEPKPRCAGHNKSANVPCHTERVSVQHEGKWFCKRHDPAKRAAAKERAETPVRRASNV